MFRKRKILHVFTIGTTPKAFFDGQFRFLYETGYNIDLVTSPEDMSEFCKHNKVNYIPIEISREISLRKDCHSVWTLLKLIRSKKYEMVVGHTPKGALLSMLAAFICNVKHRVYYRHGLVYTTATGLRRVILKLAEQMTGLLATDIVNVSPSINQLAINHHLNSSKKQEVIGKGTCGGIDADVLFNPQNINYEDLENLKRALNLTKDHFIIGFCGRLCRDKGIGELIGGVELFKNNHPNIKVVLLLVGPYDSRDILSPTIKNKISSTEYIKWVGRQPKDKLPLYYSLMDVFCLPSYREGFGMCVLEASAMEIPILVSRSHGCVDSIIDGETGDYIDISAEGICKGVETMLNNSDRKVMGKNGRQFVMENFDWTVMWPKIKDYYDSL